MNNKYLEVFRELDRQLTNYPATSNNYAYLQIMLERRLKNLVDNDGEGFLPDKISRKMIYAIAKKTSLDEIDSREANKEINVDKLQRTLNEFIEHQADSKSQFKNIGFRPILQCDNTTGGRGKERLLWLDIERYMNHDDLESENDDFSNDIYQIFYSRADTKKIKPSWFTKLIFKDNELKIRSLRGIIVMLFFILSFLLDFLLLAFAFIVFLLIRDLKTLQLWQAMTLCAFFPLVYMSWMGLLRPLHHLLTHRIIKALDLFINLNADNADIEMYRDNSGYKVARVTEFTATCPICTSPIWLADGKPDQKAPLVGRCREAPHAHVYSFDRVTLKGFFLGHEGYLKENNKQEGLR